MVRGGAGDGARGCRRWGAGLQARVRGGEARVRGGGCRLGARLQAAAHQVEARRPDAARRGELAQVPREREQLVARPSAEARHAQQRPLGPLGCGLQPLIEGAEGACPLEDGPRLGESLEGFEPQVERLRCMSRWWNRGPR
jgi:hypothetical protein